LVEVVLEADINCPLCSALEKVVRRVCDDLNVPFTVKYATHRSAASYEETTSFHTFSKDWVEKHGSSVHKSALGKIGKVLDMIQSVGLQSYPNLIVRWHDGVRPREIVIRGYDPREARAFAHNLIALLMYLKRGVKTGRD
jgi:hypothetical protein